MENFGGPVVQKYARINFNSQNALLRGNIKPFNGFGEEFNNRFLVALRFMPYAEQKIQKNIISEIERIGAESGIKFFVAGKNIQIHSTVLEGLYEGTDESERNGIFNELLKELLKNKTIRKLSSVIRNVPFHHVILDKANVLFTCVEIPDFVVQAREKLAVIYEKYGLKPLLMENILHISLARMTQLPINSTENPFQKYVVGMKKLRHSISDSAPFTVKTNKAYVGPTYEFLKSLD